MIRSALLMLLALAWVPLTSHCRLASLLDSDFLRCHADCHESADGADPCEDEVCCQVEFAKYHLPRQQELLPAAGLTILPTAIADLLNRELPSEVSLGILTAAPPDLPASWRFSLRTALPVRAPSPTSF